MNGWYNVLSPIQHLYITQTQAKFIIKTPYKIFHKKLKKDKQKTPDILISENFCHAIALRIREISMWKIIFAKMFKNNACKSQPFMY